jgi:hypothetical protein
MYVGELRKTTRNLRIITPCPKFELGISRTHIRSITATAKLLDSQSKVIINIHMGSTLN